MPTPREQTESALMDALRSHLMADGDATVADATRALVWACTQEVGPARAYEAAVAAVNALEQFAEPNAA